MASAILLNKSAKKIILKIEHGVSEFTLFHLINLISSLVKNKYLETRRKVFDSREVKSSPSCFMVPKPGIESSDHSFRASENILSLSLSAYPAVEFEFE